MFSLTLQGATGLIRYLSTSMLRSQPAFGAIEWIQNHSRNTQLALLCGYIDVALTYERSQEALSVREGWAVSAGCAFHDHFVLAGPASDPAGISASPTITAALLQIASTRTVFHSRGDASATMWKERGLWTTAGYQPWTEQENTSWYTVTELDPASALVNADKHGAYLLTDRSTLLRQTMDSTIRNTTVFFEPHKSDDILMNSCHALYSRTVDGETALKVREFLEYMLSEEGQRMVSAYGVVETGFPLFAPVADGFAHSFLRGGIPKDGKWVISNQSTACDSTVN